MATRVRRGRSRRLARAWCFCAILPFCSVAGQGGEPVITEFMADNSQTLSLAEGGAPDWIELHNPTDGVIDLGGWHLTDDALSPTKWEFPAGASVPAGGYLVVFASGDDGVSLSGDFHTNFKLQDAGEYLALVRPDGSVAQEFAPEYPRQYKDVSYGLPSAGGTLGYFQSPTPGAPNGESVLGFVKDTTFSHKRGFYDEAIQLEVTTAAGITQPLDRNFMRPHQLIFSKEGLEFVSTEFAVVGSYGATVDLDLLHALEEAQTVDELTAIQVQYGSTQAEFYLRGQQLFDRYARRYFASYNQDPQFRGLRYPDHILSDAPANRYEGEEQITRVQVRLIERWYDGTTLHLVTDRVIHRVEVPDAP